jgi:hypothetical protein
MRYIFTLIAALVLAMNTIAQTDFMPVGAVLKTKGVARGFSGSVVFTSEKDTLCGGIICRKVNVLSKNNRFPDRSSSSTQYFLQRGDSIFEYFEHRNLTFFRYKNNYAVGDSSLITQNQWYSSTLYIDSVIVSDGVKRFSARVKCVETPSPGSLNSSFRLNFYDKFLPDFTPYSLSCYWNDIPYYIPLCYSDDLTSYKTIYYTGSCDVLQTTTSTAEVSDKLILYPNPADAYVNVESPKMQFVSIKIQNAGGRIVCQKIAFTPVSLNIQDIPNGIYFVSVKTGKSLPIIQKLVVLH